MPVTREEVPVGTLVVESMRFPSVLQPWIHEIYVGTVVEPSDNIAEWNGYNSERTYCETMGYIKVRYNWGDSYDLLKYVIPITSEEASLSFRDKIARFLGEEALANFDGAMGTKRAKIQAR